MYSLLLCFSILAGFVSNESPQLTIRIENIETLEGDIRIGVFNTSDKFLTQGSTFKNYKIAVKNAVETIIIDDLPKGEYAFLLYHDKNADGKMNRNFLGIPKEPFGFSNNVKPQFAKPTFEECMFFLKEDLVLQVKLGFFK
ncbi:MAG: DUF2141 domain-containing protein [Bacteroidales bacterium]|nr:DUF2141 domain-containing protein [Bacteroidales bacterium]MDD4673067.1 DUF2141 domain-containing protein [Bacteroidales bacterium]MDY0349336.1 DUF2141 domain-containing protein [Tenuifilaceae bacterium]